MKQFSGYASEEKLLAAAAKLGAALEADGIEFQRDQFFFAGYDSPFRVFGRHNEVWYMAS